MAKHLQQLDLFGMDISQEPVHLVSAIHLKQEKNKQRTPSSIKKIAKEIAKEAAEELAENEEALMPAVSRTPMSFGLSQMVNHKRGRKSFASMVGEMEKIKVPANEELAKRLYYPIGEVASWFNVNTSLIRYWEKEFKQLQPRKTRKGDRLFRAQDIEHLKQIFYLLREKKFSIDGAKTYLKNNKEKAEKDIQLLQRLKNIKAFLLSLKSSL